MSITITDPQLTKAMENAVGWVSVEDANGRLLGRFLAEHDGIPPPGVESPFTDEQRREFRKQRDGRPLKDILRDLENRA